MTTLRKTSKQTMSNYTVIPNKTPVPTCSLSKKITNRSIRERTRQEDVENIIRKRRLRWLCHEWRMDKDRRVSQILHLVREGRKRRGRSWKNWTETVNNDLRSLEIS